VHQRLAQQDGGVVGQELGRQVVRAVHQDVVVDQQLRGGGRLEAAPVRRHLHARVAAPELARERLDLGGADRRRVVQDLPVQVGLVDHVVVDHGQAGNAFSRQGERRPTAEAAGADEQHAA
jgi:hypothetical protein